MPEQASQCEVHEVPNSLSFQPDLEPLMRATALFLLMLAAALLPDGAAAQVTALTHATVIDGTGAAPQSDVTIVMENGRIREIGTGLPAPPNATVVDLTGKFVVP